MAFKYFKILIFVQAFVYAVSFERIWQQKLNYSASQKPFYPCHDCIYMLFKLQKKFKYNLRKKSRKAEN